MVISNQLLIISGLARQDLVTEEKVIEVCQGNSFVSCPVEVLLIFPWCFHCKDVIHPSCPVLPGNQEKTRRERERLRVKEART
jgi:hypothetical protein